jgi:hypothetical protein
VICVFNGGSTAEAIPEFGQAKVVDYPGEATSNASARPATATRPPAPVSCACLAYLIARRAYSAWAIPVADEDLTTSDYHGRKKLAGNKRAFWHRFRILLQ